MSIQNAQASEQKGVDWAKRGKQAHFFACIHLFIHFFLFCSVQLNWSVSELFFNLLSLVLWTPSAVAAADIESVAE